jgi:DNA polymerase epsilon subunit 1
MSFRRFSPQATFKNPAVPFRLDLVCPFCTAVRMFDLTRDADLLIPLPPGEKREFRCLRCSHLHDANVIEAHLLEQITKAVTSFQVNDLKCDRCNSIKTDSLALWCECSGGFQNALSEARAEVIKRLEITTGIASWFDFQGLRDYCSEIKARL